MTPAFGELNPSNMWSGLDWRHSISCNDWVLLQPNIHVVLLRREKVRASRVRNEYD